MRGGRAAQGGLYRTVIQTPQPSIWLVLCVLCLAHCVILPMAGAIRSGSPYRTGRCLPLGIRDVAIQEEDIRSVSSWIADPGPEEDDRKPRRRCLGWS